MPRLGSGVRIASPAPRYPHRKAAGNRGFRVFRTGEIARAENGQKAVGYRSVTNFQNPRSVKSRRRRGARRCGRETPSTRYRCSYQCGARHPLFDISRSDIGDCVSACLMWWTFLRRQLSFAEKFVRWAACTRSGTKFSSAQHIKTFRKNDELCKTLLSAWATFLCKWNLFRLPMKISSNSLSL